MDLTSNVAPAASVIIPHYSDKGRLSLCLASLNRCADRGKVEIIVVDNGPPTLDQAFMAGHPHVAFLHEPHRGAANARNTGVLQARGDILVFTDCDCLVAPNFLTAAIAAASRSDITGGRIDVTAPLGRALTGAQAFELVFAFRQEDYVRHKSFAVTANLVTNRRVFALAGGFREGVSEDKDWCQRATALGFKLDYDPNLAVSHPSRRDWNQLRAKWARLASEGYALEKSTRTGRARWVLQAALMPASILAHAPKAFRSPRLNTLGDRLLAVATLARLRLWRMGEMIRLAAQLRA